jgi:hypothetical protein
VGEPDSNNARWYWFQGTGVVGQSFRFLKKPALEDGWNAKLAAHLKQVRAQDNVVLRWDDSGPGRLALMEWRAPDVGSPDSASLFVSPDLIAKPGVQWRVEVMEDSEQTEALFYEAVPLLVRELWQQNVIEDGQLFLGRAGVCLVSGDSLWIVPAGFDRCVLIPRQRFDEWSHDSVRLLPPTWGSVASRKALGSDQVAREIVRGWENLRRGRDWKANPMGMILNLDTTERPD